jgi:translocation and assembly module TamB
MSRGGNEIWSNGAVDISGPLTALVATGRLIVPKAQFRPTFFRSEMDPDIVLVAPKLPSRKEAPAPFLYENMRIEVSIESPGNAWLKDPAGQVEMKASIKALKQPGQKIALGGVVRAIKGTVDVHERTFKVQHATLTLPGAPGKPYLIDGKATDELDDITLVLTVTGALTNADVRLESLPPLPPADVLSYLVFGAPTATLTKEQYLALGAEQLGVLGGITTKKLDEILGSTIPFLSGIKMRTGTMGGRPSVGVAKEITKNVSVFYGRNLNEERGQYENQVGLQYKINRNWSIESQMGPRNSGADVFFNYDF